MDKRLLDKAAGPGRIRGVALAAWRDARKRPERAGPVLRRRVREARALHSRERRLVQDALYGLLREHAFIERVLGTSVPEALWLGWLVRQGLDPALAQAEHPADYAVLADAVPRDAAEAHSIPPGLFARLSAQWDPGEVAAFLAASDQRAPVQLRCNATKATREAVAARLEELGVHTTPSADTAHGLTLATRRNVEATPPFKQGWFEVQDAGSQRLAALVDPDGPVIDFCAGAGGKTLAIAAEGVPVLAFDVRPRALAELRQRAIRAGAQVETAVLRDGKPPSRFARRRASRVLVDAPCTGTGTLRRHPEHRWQWSTAWLRSRVQLQSQILSRAAQHVAPGGRLIYGTCSVLEQENERVVEKFLSQHRGFAEDGDLRLNLAPHRSGTDGFFGAVLMRQV